MTRADDLARAVDLAVAGSWDAAHEIAQRHEGDATADWLHAVLHKIEGDAGNARYWYRRAGRPMPAPQTTFADEWHDIATALLQQ